MEARRPNPRAISSRLLRALGSVGDELALHGPSRPALDGIVSSICREFGYQRVAVYLLGEDGFEKASHVGYETCHLDVTIGVVARALSTRRPQFVPDVSKDPDYVMADDGVISEICVPIIEQAEVLGILNVETVAPLTLGRDDLAFVSAVADRVAAAVVLARDRKDLAHRVRILDRLASSSARVAESLDLELVCNAVVGAAVEIIEDADVRIQLLALVPSCQPAVEIASQIDDEGNRVISRDAQLQRASDATPGFEISFQLRVLDQMYGRLCWETRSRRFTVPEKQAAELLALQSSLAIANSLAHSAVTSQSLTDALTGLPNRRQFDQTLEERRRVKRVDQGASTSVLALDLDRFGLVNKRFGHATGDAVLRGFAAVLRASLRADDAAARTGGEEFVVVLDNTELAEAMIVAERIRQSFSAWHLDVNEATSLSSTVSIGIASSQTMPVDVLIESADEALRHAKREGRNRVEAAVGRALASALRVGAGFSVDSLTP